MTKNFFITTILTTLLITGSLAASPPTFAETWGINPGAAALAINKFIAQLTEVRTTTKSARFLNFAEEPNMQPLTDAFKSVNESVDEFNRVFPDFFKDNKLKESLAHMEAAQSDFVIADAALTAETIIQLKVALDDMARIKTKIMNMLVKLNGGINSVQGIWASWESEEYRLDPSQINLLFDAGVTKLVDTLFGAIETSVTVSAQLLDIQLSMGTLKNKFGSLASKFRKGQEKNSDMQADYWGAFVNGLGQCGWDCFPAPWVFVTCTGCAVVNITEKVAAEEKRVAVFIAENDAYMTQIDDTMIYMAGVAAQLEAGAKKQKDGIDDFKTELDSLKAKIVADNALPFLTGARERIANQMAPLRQAGETLMESFKGTDYEPPQ